MRSLSAHCDEMIALIDTCLGDVAVSATGQVGKGTCRQSSAKTPSPSKSSTSASLRDSSRQLSDTEWWHWIMIAMDLALNPQTPNTRRRQTAHSLSIPDSNVAGVGRTKLTSESAHRLDDAESNPEGALQVAASLLIAHIFWKLCALLGLVLLRPASGPNTHGGEA
jgi:hypothetical protein